MTGDDPGGGDEPMASLTAVLEAPSTGRRRLPRVVGLIDHDDEAVRLGAAWAACHVAAVSPGTAPYLTRRVADRLAAADPPLAVELLFAFLDARYPDVVDDELEAVAAEADARPSVTPIDGSLARANYHLTERGNRDVGRTRLAGEGTTGPPPRVFSDDADHPPSVGRGVETAETGHDQRDPSARDDESTGASVRDDDDSTGASDPDERGLEPADRLPAVTDESRFDRLTVLARRRRDRYADVYRTLGVLDGEELPVALSMYHRPEDGSETFAAALGEQLDRWQRVDDHDNVVTVYDRGGEPRPWSATEYTDLRLADRGGLPVKEALWNARRLADAVAYLHENGVVHGGIDPGNVAYYGNVLDANERQPPLLSNVCLLHVVRQYFDPTTRLDPRYAAPEYFDRRFGRVDHATDVYHLGAVCYRLFTGKPPVDGDYETVRQAVLEHPAPRPRAVADVPAAVDDVVTKAMARQKLRRYEAVSHLQAELRGIGGE